MHATEGTLVAWLDGQGTGAERTEIEGHLAVCDACAAELRLLTGLSGEVRDALAVLDEPAPVERAYREFVANRQSAARPARVEVLRLRRLGVSSLAKAAGLALMLAGAASAAIPGSPVRRWVSDAWERVTGLFEGPAAVGEAPVDTPAVPVAIDETPTAGAWVEPADGAVTIVLRDVEPGTRIRVRLVDDDRAMIRSYGLTSPRFVRTSGRIEARGLSRPMVEIPRSVGSARVELDGRVLLIKTGDMVEPQVPVESSSADEYVFLSGT